MGALQYCYRKEGMDGRKGRKGRGGREGHPQKFLK